MKKIVLAALLSSFVAAPAFAAGAANNVGINASLDGVIGIQGEFNISSAVDNAPVSIQVFYKKESDAYSAFGVTADHKAFGVTGIYDFSSLFKMDKRFTPYAGGGLARETVGTTVPFVGVVEANSTELYLTAGLRYAITPKTTP